MTFDPKINIPQMILNMSGNLNISCFYAPYTHVDDDGYAAGAAGCCIVSPR